MPLVIPPTDALLLPRLYFPDGLRRFKPDLGDALFTRAPIVCLGDSITAGVGGDNINAFSDSPDNTQGWVGQLRTLFAKTYGDPGEGFIFATTQSARISAVGGTASTSTGPLGKSTKLVAAQSMTIAVPAGLTSVGIIQNNLPGDITATYTLDGGGSTNVQTLTGTSVPLEGAIAVSSGATHTIVLTGPATAQSFIGGVVLRNGTAGVPVHRIGITGLTSGDLLGGQNAGALALTGAQQTRVTDVSHLWETNPGMVIIAFGTNDFNFEGGGGTGSQNSITPALFKTWVKQFGDRVIANNWCVLLLAPSRINPNVQSGADPQSAYVAQLKAIAAQNDHYSFMDIGEAWGVYGAAQTVDMNLQISASVHPNRRGHGDMARLIYNAITHMGMVAPVPAP